MLWRVVVAAIGSPNNPPIALSLSADKLARLSEVGSHTGVSSVSLMSLSIRATVKTSTKNIAE